MTVNQKTEATQGRPVSKFVLPALLRLALLLGPMTAAMLMLGKSPVLCVLACVAVLALWLSVDVGPFRAGKARQPAAAAPKAQNLAKAQGWNALFCRLLLLVALFHSKLMI